ncbi:MAG: response regulator [Spirochaetes bacterium]|nr:response regulator [Spirochaetota bacterium]
MERKTRILLVEDVHTDAELAQREISKSLLSEFICVDTREDFLNALTSFKPDIIISDYQMPAFNGIMALKLAMELVPETPVIILTAATNEDTAVACMKAGARDYVIKEHIKRLGQAVLHTLEEKQTVSLKLKAEKELRKTEERLKELAENLSSVFFVYEIEEGNGRIAYLSPAFESIWIINREDIFKNPSSWLLTIYDDDREEIKTVIECLKNPNPVPVDIQFRIIDSQKKLKWIRTKASPILNKDGSLARIIGVADDITERKSAEEEKIILERQLAQAQRLESVGRLAGGVAHDFNNMLSVIIGYSELIKSDLTEDNPVYNNILEIEKAALRSRDITRQLLAFSRNQIISPRSMNLNNILESTQKSFIRLIGEDIKIDFLLADDLWNIKFDPTQMEQILMNLVVNARDAMPQGGRLIITTANASLDEFYCREHPDCTPGQYVKLSVEDNGTGMDNDTLLHIFEPFFTTKETGKGTGLGLATVYGNVKQNGGCINVGSEPGRGSIFNIFIPMYNISQKIEEKMEEEKIHTANGTILLVEDEEMLRTMITQMLKAIGYNIISAAGPIEALSICDTCNTSIDLLLTDVIMPEMNGNELKKKIEEKIAGIKTIFISGYTFDTMVKRGAFIEGANFIQKPFSISDLAKQIRSVLE